jgi:hypothetical protein
MTMKSIHATIIWIVAILAVATFAVTAVVLVQHRRDHVMSACLAKANDKDDIQQCGESF